MKGRRVFLSNAKERERICENARCNNANHIFLVWLLLFSGDLETNPGPIICTICGQSLDMINTGHTRTTSIKQPPINNKNKSAQIRRGVRT